jgi:hypothetical protein
MSQAITNITHNEVATEVVPARVEIRLVGDTIAERKLNVIAQGATAATLMALAGAKGKIGAAARSHAAQVGNELVMKSAANSNFRPLAELYSATTGYDITINNRAAFESLPNVIDALICAVTATKSKGMTVKDGVSIPNAKHAALLGIRSVAVDCIDFAAKVHAERALKREQQAN